MGDPREAIGRLLDYVIEADEHTAGHRAKLREAAIAKGISDPSQLFLSYSMQLPEQSSMAVAERDNPVKLNLGLCFAEQDMEVSPDDRTVRQAGAPTLSDDAGASMPAGGEAGAGGHGASALTWERSIGSEMGLDLSALASASVDRAELQPWWHPEWSAPPPARGGPDLRLNGLEARILSAVYSPLPWQEAERANQIMFEEELLSPLAAASTPRASASSEPDYVVLRLSRDRRPLEYCSWRCSHCSAVMRFNKMRSFYTSSSSAHHLCSGCNRLRHDVGQDVRVMSSSELREKEQRRQREAEQAAAEATRESGISSLSPPQSVAWRSRRLVSTPEACLVFLSMPSAAAPNRRFVRALCDGLFRRAEGDPPASAQARAVSHDHVPSIRPHLMFCGAPGATAGVGAAAGAGPDIAGSRAPEDPTPHEHFLSAIVCFGASHYVTYVRYAEQDVRCDGGWLLFDDASVRIVGTMADVADHIQRGRLLPVVLHFERPPLVRPHWAVPPGSKFISMAAARRDFATSMQARKDSGTAYVTSARPHPPWPRPHLPGGSELAAGAAAAAPHPEGEGATSGPGRASGPGTEEAGDDGEPRATAPSPGWPGDAAERLPPLADTGAVTGWEAEQDARASAMAADEAMARRLAEEDRAAAAALPAAADGRPGTEAGGSYHPDRVVALDPSLCGRKAALPRRPSSSVLMMDVRAPGWSTDGAFGLPAATLWKGHGCKTGRQWIDASPVEFVSRPGAPTYAELTRGATSRRFTDMIGGLCRAAAHAPIGSAARPAVPSAGQAWQTAGSKASVHGRTHVDHHDGVAATTAAAPRGAATGNPSDSLRHPLYGSPTMRPDPYVERPAAGLPSGSASSGHQTAAGGPRGGSAAGGWEEGTDQRGSGQGRY